MDDNNSNPVPTTARIAMNQEQFDTKYCHLPPPDGETKKALNKSLRKCYEPCTSGRSLLRAIVGFLPIFQWLPAYSWKSNLIGDAIGGLTVGIMHVPQGIAYAGLSGVDPVYGLYTSFFPALVYLLFGTSRHVSVGSFAAVSLMTGIANQRFLPELHTFDALHPNETNATVISDQPNAIVFVSTLTCAVGIAQLLMAVLRLEFLISYMSDQVISGFTTGAAVHVLFAQFNDIFGVRTPRRSGFGYLFYHLWDVLQCLRSPNYATIIASFSSIVFLVIGKELLNPLVKKKIPVPLPFELILIIIATAISYFMQLQSQFNVRVVSHIPVGFPVPQLPQVGLFPSMIGDAIGIAVVVVAIHVSMGKVIAKKHNYKIDAGQELYALGITGIVSSCFSTYPICTSLARSMVNENAGSKTLLSSVFSSSVLLVIILWIGPLLEYLPMSVLASIIVVALKGMFTKLSELKVLWPLSKIDFFIWLVSFVATVGYDVMPGLAISVLFALLTTVFRSQWPRWQILDRLSNTSDFGDCGRYAVTSDVSGVRVMRFDAPLLFTNVERFNKAVHNAALFDRNADDHDDIPLKLVKKTSISSDKIPIEPRDAITVHQHPVKNLVIDCSGFTYIDFMGANAMKEVFEEMELSGVHTYFAAANASAVRDLFEAGGLFAFVSKTNFYPTVWDAVTVAMRRVEDEEKSSHNNGIEVIP